LEHFQEMTGRELPVVAQGLFCDERLKVVKLGVTGSDSDFCVKL
jgi:hypothetical protein